MGFPGGSAIKNPPAMQEMQETLSEKPKYPKTRVINAKKKIVQTYTDFLEKEVATHSSTLAWKIPWTEEPGRLQSMVSQRVRHD